MNNTLTEPITLSTTPDMMRPYKTPPFDPRWRFFRWLFYLVATAVSGIAMGLLIVALPGPIMPLTTFWGSIIGVLLCLYLVVAFHEFGHAAGGKMAGYHLVYLIVAPCGWGEKSAAGGCAAVKGRLFSFGGWAYGVQSYRDGWRWRRVLFTLGGPVASLLLAGSWSSGCAFTGGMRYWPPLWPCSSIS
jgi:hypothetical protein